MGSDPSVSRPLRQPASKPYIRLGVLEHVPLRNRVLGVVIGLPLVVLGVRAFRGGDPVGMLILGFAGLMGGLILLGAIGTQAMQFADGRLRMRYAVLGVPVFHWTLVHRGEAMGLRHIRRVGTFFAADGTRLDEHLMVLATERPREYVVADLGAHAAAANESISQRAQALASQYGLPLMREWDGDPQEGRSP